MDEVIADVAGPSGPFPYFIRFGRLTARMTSLRWSGPTPSRRGLMSLGSFFGPFAGPPSKLGRRGGLVGLATANSPPSRRPRRSRWAPC